MAVGLIFAAVTLPAQSTRSCVVAWVPATKTVDGRQLTYRPAGSHRILYGSPGSFAGDGREWDRKNGSGSALPGSIENLLAQMRSDVGRTHGNVGFNYEWADNVRTLVVLSVDLSRLPGLEGTGAAAQVTGVVDTRDTRAGSARERLTQAIRHGSFYLPLAAYRTGITDAQWDRLVDIVDSGHDLGGLPLRVVAAYDYELGDAQALNDANTILIEARQLKRRIRRQAALLPEMGRLYSSEQKAKLWELAGKEPDLPAALAFRAWQNIDRDDHGPATAQLVRQAEQALKALPERLESAPYVALASAQDTLVGNPLVSVIKITDNFYGYNAAFVRYTRGILEENLARLAQNDAEREKHRQAAANAFAEWRENATSLDEFDRRDKPVYVRYEDDPFHVRAVAIALHNGSRGFPRRRDEAFKLFAQADKLGSVDARNWHGLYLSHYAGKAADPAAAARKFDEVMRAGNSYGRYNLGIAHLFGAGVPQDEARAWQLIKDSGINTPVITSFLAGSLPKTWQASSPTGDEMVVTLIDDYPAALSTATGGDTGPGRGLRFKVDYKLASTGSARILPETSAAFDTFSPSPLLRGAGEHTVWIANTQTNQWTSNISIRLLDGASGKVLLRLNVPVIARWDPGATPAPAAAPKPALTEEETKQINERFQAANEKLRAGDFAAALAMFDEILRQAPRGSNVLVARARAKTGLKDPAGALADLDRAIDLGMKTSEPYLLRARLLVAKEDLVGAATDADTAVRLDPKKPIAFLIRAEVSTASGKTDAALADLSTALELDSKYVAALYQRAKLHQTREDNASALADYGRILEILPDNTTALSERGWLRFAQLDMAGARADAAKALMKAPHAAILHRLDGYAAFAQSDWAGAVAALDKAAEQDKTGRAVYPLLVRHHALLRLGPPDKRLGTSWGAWADDPWAQTLARFAVGQISEEVLESTATVPAEEAQLKSRRCEMHFYAGLARWQAGDRSAARLHFQAVLATEQKGFIEYTLASVLLKTP